MNEDGYDMDEEDMLIWDRIKRDKKAVQDMLEGENDDES